MKSAQLIEIAKLIERTNLEEKMEKIESFKYESDNGYIRRSNDIYVYCSNYSQIGYMYRIQRKWLTNQCIEVTFGSSSNEKYNIELCRCKMFTDFENRKLIITDFWGLVLDESNTKIKFERSICNRKIKHAQFLWSLKQLFPRWKIKEHENEDITTENMKYDEKELEALYEACIQEYNVDHPEQCEEIIAIWFKIDESDIYKVD